MQSSEDRPIKKPVGRPRGEPSTIINIRIPKRLLGRLDHYLDRTELRTRQSINRGIIIRQVLEEFLEDKDV